MFTDLADGVAQAAASYSNMTVTLLPDPIIHSRASLS